MVISDFYIMCLSQTKQTIIDDPDLLVTSYRIPVKSRRRFLDGYAFAQSLYGMWYDFEPKERANEDYSGEWFDLEVKNNQYVLVLNEKYKEKVLNIINCYIDFSPIKHVGILFRLQGGQKERVRGIVSRKKFTEMLLQNKVRYNCLYIVTN